MANGNVKDTPMLSGYANKNPDFEELYSKLAALRQSLPEDTISALRERERQGYKPVNIQEKYIDVEDEKKFNQYRRLFGQIPNDPSRNRLIAELGYKPILRYKKSTTRTEQQPVKISEPKTNYELDFSTMPGQKMNLANEQEYNQAKLISDIDTNIADVFQKKFAPKGLDRGNAYQSYLEASKSPDQYKKMYLSEDERNKAVAEYAKSKGLNPEETINTYVQGRSKFYPRDLVAGGGPKEMQGQEAAQTLYGYRNYLTTLLPKSVTTNVERTEMKDVPITEEQEVTYPFKFGYKSSGPNRPPNKGVPPGSSIGIGDCPGGICEKSAERMAIKNKFLFRKKEGGKITDLNISNFKKKFGL